MSRFLFIILFLGFFVQCTGAALYVKQSQAITEQYPDDGEQSGEKGDEEIKKDKDQSFTIPVGVVYAEQVVYNLAEITQYCPGGFFVKPYQPPRY